MINKKGLIPAEIMLSAAIIILLTVILIPAARRIGNERAARGSILALSEASEDYAGSHAGAYPATLDELTSSIPAASDFCSDLSGRGLRLEQGYEYKCVSSAGGYTFEASPVISGIAGNRTYTVTTGGRLTPQNQ